MIDVKRRWSGDNALCHPMPVMMPAGMAGFGFNLAAGECKEQATG